MKRFTVFPTGDLRNEDKNTPITAPVPLPIVFSQLTGPFTALDRKLWLLLLHLEWNNLDSKSGSGKWHEVAESELIKLFEKFSGTKDIERIWNSVRRLTKTHVEYQFVEDDERWEGASTIFMGQYKPKQRRDGLVRFMFPPGLVPIFKEPGRFARLQVELMLRLDSKYAITLYQVLESVANKRSPVLDATVDEIRVWLKVPEDKLKTWQDLERRALSPALKEINSNPELSGIRIDHEIIRSGRGGKVQKVRFVVNKLSVRAQLEQTLLTSKRAKESASVSRLIPPFKGTSIYTKAKKLAPQFDIYYLEREWRDWVSQSDLPVKNPEAHFLSFVKRKAKI